jgi:outer membrane protein, heavy metal efflux system
MNAITEGRKALIGAAAKNRRFAARFTLLHIRILFALLALAGFAGCASIEAKPGFEDVQQQVMPRLGQSVRWNQGTREDEAAKAAVKALLKDTLTVDQAVQIALLDSPSLQAAYERLGLAQADLVRSGLLANPVFSASWRTSAVGIEREFGIVQDFLSLLTLAPRKQVATSAFDKAKLDVAHEVLKLAAEVKSTYYLVEGGEQALELFEQALTAARAAAEFAQRQYEAGTLSQREQALHQEFYARTVLEAARGELALASDREKLNRLMGLWGEDTQWKVPRRLPDVPQATPTFEKLESQAISERLDLAAAKKEHESVAAALGFATNYRFLSSIGLGWSYKRESDGQKLKGPSVELGLPLFDRGQASIGRLHSQLRESERNLEALAIDIRSQVREAHTRLLVAQQSVQHYRTAVLPLNQRIVTETLKFYNGMLLGVYDLLAAKQNQINAGRDYIAATKDYWLAHADLERALGGHLPGPQPTEPKQSEPKGKPEPPAATPARPQGDHEHHH